MVGFYREKVVLPRMVDLMIMLMTLPSLRSKDRLNEISLSIAGLWKTTSHLFYRTVIRIFGIAYRTAMATKREGAIDESGLTTCMIPSID